MVKATEARVIRSAPVRGTKLFDAIVLSGVIG
jgi:hypothetical protein